MTAVPIVAALGAILVLAGCQMPQQPRQFGGTSPALRATYTQASLQQANRQVDRFEAARSTQGMSGVSADIENCYRNTTRPVLQFVPLRECMIYDTFAVRLDEEVTKQLGLGGGIPFFSKQAFGVRLQRYAAQAGFYEPQVMVGYLRQGADTMFAVVVDRQRSSPRRS